MVTLAGLIGWQGLHLYLLSPQGAINIPDQGIIAALTHAYLPAVAGWSFGAVMIGCYLAAVVVDVRRRRAAVLPCPALWRRTVRLACCAPASG